MQTYSDAGVAVIELTSDNGRNLLTPPLVRSLREAFEAALADDACRAILLRSAERVFSHGMDLALLMQTSAAEAVDPLSKAVNAYADLLLAMYTAPKPVACVVAGEAKAGGIGLICACDIVYATPDASFELGEVLFGLIPANVLPYLLGMRLSPQKARYVALTAQCLDAREARHLGLVDELFEQSDMEGALRALFRRLLRSSPEALAEVKRFGGELLWRPVEEGSRRARALLTALATSPKTRAGLAAFGEGQTPDWFARFKPSRPLFNA